MLINVFEVFFVLKLLLKHLKAFAGILLYFNLFIDNHFSKLLIVPRKISSLTNPALSFFISLQILILFVIKTGFLHDKASTIDIP